jgi:tripartite-type tricarboxylate transporter receptor subunit TctC
MHVRGMQHTGDDMPHPTRRAVNLALALVLAGLASTQAAHAAEDAASYPSRPITIVVGFPPGGPTDIIARVVATRLSQAWGNPVIVENKPGAGSNIATEQVVRAAPDGYTLLVETIANATNMTVYKKLNYDTRKDLAPIVQFMASPSVLVTGPKVPAKNLKELLALAKAQPGKLDYASTGVGGSPHLAGEMLKYRAGIDIVHIPYKGGGQAQTDVAGGQAQMMFNVVPSALPLIKAGKLRALGVSGKVRADSLPDVPTMIEAGLPGYTATTWNGILTTAGTPKEIVAKLNDALVRALRTPEMKEALAKIGQDVAWSTPEEFAAFLREETDKWRKVIKATGLKLQ